MDCPAMPETTYGSWSAALERKSAGKRMPVSGSLELTYRCNNRCVHCYCNLPAGGGPERAREMTTSEICAFMDEMAEAGCLWLLMTGGEILLREDFREIYLHAKKLGFLVTLYTNGTLVSGEIADLLARWRPLCVEISLYGATEQTYEAVTQSKGSFNRCISGIERLVSRQIPLQLKSTLITLNAHELPAMQEFAASRGLFFRYDPLINFRTDGGRGPGAYRLTPEQVVQADGLFHDARKAWVEEALRRGSQQRSGLYSCRAGVSSFHVDPYGTMGICMMVRKMSCSLRQRRFADIWADLARMASSSHFMTDSPCRTCSLASICGSCAGWAELETGDEEAPVEFLCRVARTRAETFFPSR